MPAQPKKSLVRRFVDWVKRLFPAEYRDHEPRKPPEPSQPEQSDEGEPQSDRYQVQDEQQNTLHATDSLGEALQAWKDQTDQRGKIIDTASGTDITPEPDDNGRFVVLDESGEQVGTYNNQARAEHVWEEETGKRGSIIDTELKQDVTPFAGYLTDEEIAEAQALVQQLGGRGWSHGIDRFGNTRPDPDRVAELIKLVNKLDLRIFSLANAEGSGIDLPTKTVEITKRESVVEKRKRDEWQTVPIAPASSRWLPTVTPTDEIDIRPIDDYQEVTRVSPADLVRPDFAERYARHELPIREHQLEEVGETPTRRMKVMVDEEVIVPREWQETVEVTDQQRTQLLYLVVDISGSMYYTQPMSIEIAIALCVVLITKHLHDDSRYFFSWFADDVDETQEAKNRRGKEELIEFILRADPARDIGGGTAIARATSHAANEVRHTRRSEVPEVLLITDGSDNITAMDVFDAIGTDVVLHTAVINNQNRGLEQHSTTYEEVQGHDLMPTTQLEDRWRDDPYY